MADLDVNKKAEIYETLSSLNLAFAGIVQHLKKLHDTGLFRSEASKLFPSFAQELQAEFNQEFLDAVQDLEMEDWYRFGKVRQKWQKSIRDPDDVFIQAEERRKEIAKERKKERKK